MIRFNKLIILTATIASIQFSSFAQSELYWSFNSDLGITNGVSFTQNNLQKKFSPQTGISTSFIYRWKNIISLEAGVGQHFSNIRLRDEAFETLNDKFSVTYNNKNSYWNYYGSLGFNIPFDDYTFLYTQCSYSFNNYGGGTVNKSENFIIAEQNKNQGINSITNYVSMNSSLIPEIGMQFKTNDYDYISFGIKYNLGQSNMLTGNYSVYDSLNNQTLHTDNFTSKGNFISFNVKYAVMLWQKSKKEKKVTLCHKGETIKVRASLVNGHLAHGDTKGECAKTPKEKPVKEPKVKEEKEPKEKKKKDEMIYVCHFGKNKKIPARLLDIHLKHGDSEGKCQKEPKEKKEKPVKEDKPKEEKPKKEELKTTKDGIPKTLKDRKIEKEGTVYVESTNLTFKVWDSGKEVDGDTISLNLNGQWVLEEFGLKRSKHEVTVQISPNGKNFLMLYALNLGKWPPNTAAISVWDGKREQVLELKSNLEMCGALNIVYKPK